MSAGKENRLRVASPPWREGPGLAVLAHGSPLPGNPDPHRRGVRRPRSAAPHVRSVLVSSIWLRAGFRLAFERRDDDRVRRRQRVAARDRARVGPLRRRGKRRRSKKSPAQIAAVCDGLGRDPDALVHASRTPRSTTQRSGRLSALPPWFSTSSGEVRQVQ